MTAFTFAQPVFKAKRGGRGLPGTQRIEQLGNAMTRVVATDLTGGLKRFSRRVDYDAMAKAVYSGDYRRVFKTLPMAKLPDDVAYGLSALQKHAEDVSDVAVANVKGALGTGRNAAKPYVLDSLKLTAENPKVDEYLDTRVASLVENVTEGLQVNIQSLVRSGYANNQSPKDIADKIKTCGLTLNTRQSTALDNYTLKLTKDGVKAAEIKRLTGAYADRLLEQRSMMIARTETAYTQNFAQLTTWQAAQDRGLLPQNAQKVWVVDGDPCYICVDLMNQSIDMDEMYETIEGDKIDGPPAHPHCRCQLGLNTSRR